MRIIGTTDNLNADMSMYASLNLQTYKHYICTELSRNTSLDSVIDFWDLNSLTKIDVINTYEKDVSPSKTVNYSLIVLNFGDGEKVALEVNSSERDALLVIQSIRKVNVDGKSYFSSRSSYSSSPSRSSSVSTQVKSSSTTTYKPVSSSSALNVPYKQSTPVKQIPVKKPESVKTNKAVVPVKTGSTSYSDLKKKRYEQKGSDSNFLSWVLLAWILSDSGKSNANTTVAKEVVVDCKNWLKENGQHRAKDSKLTDKEFKQIKEYCENAGV